MRKFLFPFLNNNRHNFLLKEWWFRAIATLYIFLLFISIPLAWFSLVANQYYNCENNIKSNYGDEVVSGKKHNSEYWNAIAHCNEIEFIFGWDIQTFAGVFFFIAILHYSIQAIFFKVIVDYIILGGKRD